MGLVFFISFNRKSVIIASGLDEKIISGSANWNERYGNKVEILDLHSKRLIYAHLREVLVSVGQYITQGKIIATVGPKNVYGVPNNPYKDSYGNPTNRFYYWSSLTFKHKERRQSRRSSKLLLSKLFNNI